MDSFIKSINWKVGKFSFLPIFLGSTLALLDVVMMALGKLASQGKIQFGTALFGGTLAHSIAPYIFFKALKYESLTAMNLIWDLSSDVIVTILGVFYFGESIKGLRWLAVLFALFSLALFSYTEG
jgi:drug/metabolite transporter (DMT)-like permease